MFRARPSVALLVLLAAAALAGAIGGLPALSLSNGSARAAARPAPKPPAPAPTDTAAATDTAASDGSIQVTATLGAAPVPGQWTVCPAPGKFITCLLATQDALWVGTEDASLWRLDLAADPTQPTSWKQFTTADTRTDNIYGLAQDFAGRLWVGTQNQGVSVYNGKRWQNYGVIDGPIGEHVFSIAADPDPKRGTVWIATDHGLTSWTPEDSPKSKVESPKSTTSAATGAGATGGLSASAPAIDPFAAKGISDPTLAAGTWRSFTRGDGLPADQIYAVTVAPGGRVWIGTECDGLAWSDPPYKTWTSVRAGAGLPSNLTNSLLALPDGTLAYGTCYGLGLSRDGGQTWRSWQGVSLVAHENYLRGLAYDKAGGLWIATRQKGLVRLDPRTGLHRSFTKPILPDDYVFDVAVTRDGSVWAGTYGGGLAYIAPSVPVAAASAATNSAIRNPQSAIPSDNSAAWKAYAEAISGKTRSANAPVSTDQPANTPTLGSIPSGAPRPAATPTAAKPVARDPNLPPLLPAPAAPPTLDELNAMLAAVSKVPYLDPAKQPAVIRLDDDWLTKGDCLGRYGRYWSVFCSICSPKNYLWGAGPENVFYSAKLGPNHRKDDSLRHWIQWLYTQNPNSLEMPPVYYDSRVVRGFTTAEFTRCQAEWDDHGETYPMSMDGPGMYCNLKFPAGLFYLSLYDFNKDGHVAANRYRDFTFSVRPHGGAKDFFDISAFKTQPELAHSRIRDFWGGAYKRFLVRGPTEITVEVGRNHSFCTILAGLFVDLVDEEPVPYFKTYGDWKRSSVQQDAEREDLRTMTTAARAARFRPAASESEAAARLFDEVEKTRLTSAVWWAVQGRLFYAPILRWSQAAMKNRAADPERQALLARATTCQYELGLYQAWETGETALGKTPVRQIEKSLKWDGVSNYGGKDYRTVVEYLRDHPRTLAAVAGGRNMETASSERTW